MNIKRTFAPFNRLLAKKSKSKANISKSMTNLSDTMPSTEAYDSSQMHQNRILPLPAATSNDAFEQTFRITVLLPNKQLYVARLGARVPLQKLLELVCEDKEMNADNYEFRHPTDSGQIFSCDLAIGSVGLSKIRLCQITDPYDTFNAEDNTDDSESVSEISNRSCKHATKPPNSYSSYISQNSVSSSSGVIGRKKRFAPRPPNQNTTTENAVVPQNILRKDFHASSPNICLTDEASDLRTRDFVDSNESVGDIDENSDSEETNGEVSSKRPMSLHILNQKVAALNARHTKKNPLTNGKPNLPEPTPRTRVVPMRQTRQFSSESTEELYSTPECEADVLSFLPSVQQARPVAHPRANL